ncbi:MAG: xanthine dehydrogenase family protein molybdopterin-binding subunit [Nitrososphaerota archaeon]|nr:xanthine dehydrogenase family protein molybdopterin-binding subunit [Nitrososphaerota archaeon]
MASVQTSIRKEAAVLGAPMKRVEDMKFITGFGRFTDDVSLPKMLHAWFVRSLHAHARIKEIDASEALSLPGVRLVLTGRDLVNNVNSMPTVEASDEQKPTDRPVLATKEANFAGEPVALVVAEDPDTAEDAAELVSVTYDPLPPVVDPVKAADPKSPKVHDYLKDNIGYRSTKSFGSVSKAFKEGDHVVKFEQEFPRLSAVPMEPRAAIASYDEASQTLTVWLSSQDPHGHKEDFASILRLPENRVRVISPDTG